MLAPNSSLAGVNAADLVARYLKSPERRHFSPGVIAVPRQETEPMLSHDAATVHLYFQESLTFVVFTTWQA